MEAELTTPKNGVKDLVVVGLEGDTVKGDSYCITQWARGSLCPWKFLDMVVESGRLSREKGSGFPTVLDQQTLKGR